MPKDVLILEAKRMPQGKFGGMYSETDATWMLSQVIREITRNNGAGTLVGEAIIGQVLQAGSGQAPARQAAIGGGLARSCHAVAINKVCSSSLYAITDAASHIKSSDSNVVIAGGMESMTRSPYILPRIGTNFGSKKFEEMYEKYLAEKDLMMLDTMEHDGLSDGYAQERRSMGLLADLCARVYEISREDQDAFALESHRRALAMHDYIPYLDQFPSKANLPWQVTLFDEGVREPNPEKMAGLDPYFSEDGTCTAGNSSQISDGAAALLLSSRTAAKSIDATPLAKIVAYATHSQDPTWYTTAPVGAIEKVLIKADLSIKDIALFEINEAFAVVPLHAMRELNIPHEKVNIWGGAIALGHPIGASGARIVVTLIHALRRVGGRYGLAVACNGGGEAVSIVVENLQV